MEQELSPVSSLDTGTLLQKAEFRSVEQDWVHTRVPGPYFCGLSIESHTLTLTVIPTALLKMKSTVCFYNILDCFLFENILFSMIHNKGTFLSEKLNSWYTLSATQFTDFYLWSLQDNPVLHCMLLLSSNVQICKFVLPIYLITALLFSMQRPLVKILKIVTNKKA